LTVAFAELRAGQVTTKAACALIGRPRASHYRRHLLGPVHGPKQARRVPDNGQALTAAEQAAVLELINTKPYADLAIGQIWTRKLDEGRYLCSMSSMYSDRPGRRSDPRKAPTGDTSSEGQAGVDGRRAVPDLVVGHRAPRGAF
jgi:putative transposase